MEENQTVLLDEILTEPEMQALLGVNKSGLDYLRSNRQLPFCSVTRTNRIYLVKDVLRWLESTRVVLNKHV